MTERDRVLRAAAAVAFLERDPAAGYAVARERADRHLARLRLAEQLFLASVSSAMHSAEVNAEKSLRGVKVSDPADYPSQERRDARIVRLCRIRARAVEAANAAHVLRHTPAYAKAIQQLEFVHTAWPLIAYRKAIDDARRLATTGDSA